MHDVDALLMTILNPLEEVEVCNLCPIAVVLKQASRDGNKWQEVKQSALP